MHGILSDRVRVRAGARAELRSLSGRSVTWLLSALAVMVSSGCGDSAEVINPSTEEPLTAVPLGKEDNFLSDSAREFLVEGRTTIVLEDDDLELSPAEQEALVRRLVPFKQMAVTWFLNVWIAPKDNEDENRSYGGFNALAKNATFDELDLVQLDERTWEFTARVEMSGSVDLLDRLPLDHGADGTMTVDLAMGILGNEEMQQLGAGDEWFRQDPWEHFDPKTLPEPLLETITLTITPQPRSNDAWLDTPRLFEDGKVDIAVHFGWDYHDASHIKESQLLFGWLVDQGYRAPVARWDDLNRKSGPFERTITAGGKPVDVSIWVYFGKPGSSTDPDTAAGARNLRKDMIRSLETREVVVYSGHSGPFWGFSLGNWKKTDEGELEDNVITTLDLPEHYQIVLAEGCETYSMAQAFFDNPAKQSRTNLDLITTSTYSTAFDALPVKDFLTAVVGTFDDGSHAPSTWGELLRDLDWNAWDPAMYGVHGIDDNPHLHPYAEPDRFCEPCTWWSDCGDAGNFCLRMGTDGRFCSAECTSDAGCPTGFVCAAVARGQSITSRACVPESFSCESDDAPTQRVIINELLADPPNDASGDLNDDGFFDADEDEYVELYNPSNRAVPIGGWTIADGTKVRFTVPGGVTLPAYGVAVVFGGGDPSALKSTGALLFAAESGLSLSNAGDSIVVRAADGRVIDRVVFGAEADGDKALVRETDGDPESPLVPYPGDTVGTPGV